MKAGIGRIVARLGETEERVSQKLLTLINTNINPPAPVGEGEVFIRAMFIVSDEVNSFGGRFPRDEYERLCELLVDSPVMVGHRKDKLPIGRNFHAIIVEKDNRQWIKSYFYWLKNASGAETLRDNIDGGIYKECSIGFSFHFPECSICGKDIRICEHEPFQTYPKGNHEETCHFMYRKIERVLETSLVYRGAVPDTEISKDLMVAKHELVNRNNNLQKEMPITSPLALAPNTKYLLVPYYDGIPVVVHYANRQLAITTADKKTIPEPIVTRFAVEHLPDFDSAVGYILGFRGKERCPAEQVRKFLAGKPTRVTRLEMRLLPQEGLHVDMVPMTDSKYPVRMIRYSRSEITGLRQAAQAIMTRDGVRLWDEKSKPLHTPVYWYNPNRTGGSPERIYTLHCDTGTGQGRFLFEHNNTVEQFILRQFNLSRFRKGGRFIADNISDNPQPQSRDVPVVSGSGTVEKIRQQGNGFVLSLRGMISGTGVLKPMKLNGKQRHLFYLVSQEKVNR